MYADLNTVPTADAATMGKMAWERTAMLMDAGRDLNSIIGNADATEARAIATWAPTWWKINPPLDPSTRNANMLYGKSGEPETDWIPDAVADRLGEPEPTSVPAMLSPDRVELERAELLERIGVGIATGQLEAVIEVSRAIPGLMQDIDPEAYTSNGNVRAGPRARGADLSTGGQSSGWRDPPARRHNNPSRPFCLASLTRNV